MFYPQSHAQISPIEALVLITIMDFSDSEIRLVENLVICKEKSNSVMRKYEKHRVFFCNLLYVCTFSTTKSFASFKNLWLY